MSMWKIIKSLGIPTKVDWCRRIFLVGAKDRTSDDFIHEQTTPFNFLFYFFFLRRYRNSSIQKQTQKNLSSCIWLYHHRTRRFLPTEDLAGKKWIASLCGLHDDDSIDYIGKTEPGYLKGCRHRGKYTPCFSQVTWLFTSLQVLKNSWKWDIANGGIRGIKQIFTKVGHRVPMIIKMAGEIKAGTSQSATIFPNGLHWLPSQIWWDIKLSRKWRSRTSYSLVNLFEGDKEMTKISVKGPYFIRWKWNICIRKREIGKLSLPKAQEAWSFPKPGEPAEVDLFLICKSFIILKLILARPKIATWVNAE